MRFINDTVYAAAKRVFGHLGLKVSIDYPFRNPAKLFAAKATELGVRTVLDVGANSGQFALELREQAYDGMIVSFEPLLRVHARLARSAARDKHWVVMPPMALGDVPGKMRINISDNLASSSLLPVERRSVEAAAESEIVGFDEVEVRRLDDVVDSSWQSWFALKLDTQGFELHVLRGAPETLKRTVLVAVELSLTPLYAGGATFAEVHAFLEKNGFRCIGFLEVFADRKRNEVLQVDGIYVRSVPPGT